MMLALQKFVSGPTMIAGETKSFSLLNKPILITVCKSGQFDTVGALGYEDTKAYLIGETGNESSLSWTGAGGNLTVNETLSYLFKSHIESICHEGLKTITTRFLLPFGFCSVAEGTPVELLDDDLNKHSVYFKENGEYFVSISDSTVTLRHYLPMPLMTGDRMRVNIRPDQPKKKHYYSATIKETIIETEDGSCAIYPGHANFESYSDCVDEENHRKILPVLGCMVPWMSDSDQCIGPVQRLPKHDILIKWLKFDYKNSKTGFQYKSLGCPLPCTQLSAHSNYIRSADYDKNKLVLYVEESVKVESVGLAYGWDSLLVEIGSCLGLWLGLSVVGLYDFLVSAVVKMKSMLNITKG